MERASKLLLLTVFSALLLSNTAFPDFSMKSLTVSINVNQDGSANVEERLDMAINGAISRELYDATRSAYSDLTTWKNRTELGEMRHHITRAKAEITSLRITPQAVERCNSFIGICYATVVIDYMVPAEQNGSGLVYVDRYKPRTAKYSLMADALSFEQTKTGDIVLPSGTTIAISIPAPAEKIYFSAPPSNIAADDSSFTYDQSANLRYYTGKERTFRWQSDSLSKFQFTYEIESPLESEVLSFFSETQNSVMRLFLGPEGAAVFIIVATSILSIYYLNRIGRK